MWWSASSDWLTWVGVNHAWIFGKYWGPSLSKVGNAMVVLETHDKGKTCTIDESPLLPTWMQVVC